jgi:hypothetical protein
MMTRRNFIKLCGQIILAGCLGYTQPPETKKPNTYPSKDPAIKFLEENPLLSYKFFSQQEFEWGKFYVEYHGKEFLKSYPELHETLNSKIRQEGFIFREMGMDINDEEVQNFIGENWDYHYNLWKDEKSLFSLSSDKMREDFPKREDREVIYRGMWLPRIMTYFDIMYKGDQDLAQPKPQLDVLEKNAEVIFNGRVYKRIMNAYEDPDYIDLEFATPSTIRYYNSKEEEIGIKPIRSDQYWAWDRYKLTWLQFAINPKAGFSNTGKMFGEVYDPFLQEKGGRFVDIERFIYGLSLRDAYYEQYDSNIAPIYAKSIGGAVFEQLARYPQGAVFNGVHQTVAMPVPRYIVKEVKSNPSKYGTPIIGPGQTISLYCAEEPLIKDNVPWVVQVLPTDKEIDLFCHPNITNFPYPYKKSCSTKMKF